MARFVAVACLLAGCAQGSMNETTDASEADSSMVTVDAAPPDACIPATELCNNKDDDCDGMVDDGFGVGMPCDGVDNDACNEGMVVCDSMGGTGCFDPSGDTVEVCNGMDDDCQNGPDDTFDVDDDCTVGLGACAATGKKVCNVAMNDTTCNAVAGTPTAELCGNTVDEDCNGADATCPVNDLPAGAIDISAGGTFTVDLSAAHDDNFAVSTPTLDCGNMGGRDAFYQFTLGVEEVVYFDAFGSNFDTVIRVFSGACTGIASTQACSDDACATTRSQGAVDLLAGTYCLVLDQFSSNTTAGMASLTFRRGGRPGVPLTTLSGTFAGTTAGKTNLSIASCEANTSQPDVGHFFLSCPNKTYTVNANTCTNTAFDTILYLRTGSATTDVACSDDVTGCGSQGLQSRITGASVSGPNVHWLIVDGFGASGNGNYSLTYSAL